MSFFRSFGRNWFEYGKGKTTFQLGRDSLSGHERNYFFRNDGGRFVNVSWVTGTANDKDGRGFVPADYDRDGDLDFFLTNNNQPAAYYENRHPDPGNWLTVLLRGTKSNSHGIGARLILSAGGKRQLRHMHLGSGYLSSPPPECHFGLARATRVAKLVVRWPSGQVQTLRDLPANAVIRVTEGKGWKRVRARGKKAKK